MPAAGPAAVRKAGTLIAGPEAGKDISTGAAAGAICGLTLMAGPSAGDAASKTVTDQHVVGGTFHRIGALVADRNKATKLAVAWTYHAMSAGTI